MNNTTKELETEVAVKLDALAQVLGIETAMGHAALAQMARNAQLLDRKQKDYGSSNISDCGEVGLIVRSNDKMARLKNLVLKAKSPNNESIDDSWQDLANYAVIAQLVRKGVWK